MKCLILAIIGLFIFVAAGEEGIPESLMRKYRIHYECVNEIGVTTGPIGKTPEYLFCVVKKLGVFTEEGGYDIERLLVFFSTENINVERMRESIRRCVDNNEQKSTPMEWANRNMMCMEDDLRKPYDG